MEMEVSLFPTFFFFFLKYDYYKGQECLLDRKVYADS